MGQHDDDSGPGSGDKGDDRRRDEGKDTSRHSVEDDKQTATTPT